MRLKLLLFFCVIVQPALYANFFDLKSGNLILSVTENPDKSYGLSFVENGKTCLMINGTYPVTLEVNGKTLNGFYHKAETGDNTIRCRATIKSDNGSVFDITDVFTAEQKNYIKLDRKVDIIQSADSDKFFNSYFGITFKENSTITDFDFFVPGIWYKDNQYLRSNAMASDYSDNYFYFREDRLPLPVISARDKTTGTTVALIHLNANPETFYGENGLDRIVDERMQFGSLGFTQDGKSNILFVFPGIEGEKTYTGRIRDKSKVFSYRSHPVKTGVKHSYSLLLGFTETNDIAGLVESVWKNTWELYNPQVCDMDVKDAYEASIEVLDAYLENVNGAPGWPFAIYLPNGVSRAYNYQMGFVGFQLSNAYFLLRNGLENANEDYIRRASEVLDFWVNESMTEFGLPRTWADAYADRKATWREYETYMRSTAGGMEGMIAAWSIMKKHNINKPQWLQYCKTYADWLAKNQQPDGSFYIRYRWEDGVNNHDSKYTTTNVIRLLIELYTVTGDKKYLSTALKAGNFSYDFIHNDYLYVGGVIDNPNVKDRESGQLAIYAFLGLYDATKDNKWKNAAIQAARYTETFMFSYDVPMAINDTLTDFPKGRDITGQTLIATGHSGIDNGLSFSSFQYYRLYLMTGDEHFLHVARIIQNNTLQLMDLDGRMGYKYRGLVTECFNPQANRGHSVRQQLPWNQAAVLEPMHRFMDAFNEWDIDVIEQWPREKKMAMMEKYIKTQGLAKEKR